MQYTEGFTSVVLRYTWTIILIIIILVIIVASTVVVYLLATRRLVRALWARVVRRELTRPRKRRLCHRPWMPKGGLSKVPGSLVLMGSTSPNGPLKGPLKVDLR